MQDPSIGAAVKRYSVGRALFTAWQTCVAALLGLVALGMLVSDGDKLAAPTAPTTLFWTTFALGLLVALAHLSLPFLRRRLPTVITYVSTFAFVVLWFVTFGQVEAAWQQTPKGAAEASFAEEELRNSDAADAERQQEQEQQRRATEAKQQADNAANEQQKKVEACFTMFGHRLPKLEETVKSGLGNPDSFQHVKTEAMPTDVDGYDVLMTFRAQNRMGALWTYGIRASVNPESCEITNIEAQPSQS